jgi:hypothetical protein
MNTLMLFLALIAGQSVTMQERPVVRLLPHHDSIDVNFGGKLLKLDHAPAILHLPQHPPTLDDEGNPWSLEIKNFGPDAVTVADREKFKVQIAVGQTIFINSNGAAYVLKANGAL